MLELPYINSRAHLATMMLNYDVFAGTYNAAIKAKRAADPDNASDFQTLKPTHRALYKDLVFEIGKKMLQHIKNYQTINTQQGNTGTFKLLSNPICGDGIFVCSTNRYQLSKHNGKENSTIYRNILRLMEAGIITEKIGHGKKSNFELHINADFLIISDHANPAYNPLENVENDQKTAPAGSFAPGGKIAVCKEKKNVQEHLINKIYSATAGEGQFSKDQVSHVGKIGEDKPEIPAVNSTGSEIQPITGTLTGTTDMSTPALQTPFKPTGGRADVHNMLAAKGVDYVKVFTKKDPKQWHAFHRLSHAAYFVDYTIQAIYSKRGVEIFPPARIAAIEYAEKYYFPNPLETDVKTIFRPCETLDQYANRLDQLKWCVDAANRYAAKNNAYFVLISKYIDIQNENGLKRTFTWWSNAKKNFEDKAKHLKNIKEMKMLHEKVRELAEGRTTLMEAENYVESNIPKYKFVFRHSLVTVINQLNKE